MDTRPHERARQALHGLVRPPLPLAAHTLRALLAAGVLLALLSGIAGGLLRAGVALPWAAGSGWLGAGALHHAALMTGGFLGTVIGIERAVAVKHPAAFWAPLASVLGALCLLVGLPELGAWLGVLAATVFTTVTAVIVRRQPAAHTGLLLLGAIAWGVGNLLFATGHGGAATLPWWFAFLVMTIAAERLEMTRLMRRRPAAQASLHLVLLALLLGAAASAVWPVPGGVVYGLALTALALWLGVFDIARRTVWAHGLSRYMALCLLSGYAWLAVAGVAWAATALGLPLRDLALHGLGLGFIVSMVMGHAPVILPAIARVKLQFGWAFYLPWAALHLSLALRLGLGFDDPELRALGAGLNAAAIAGFAATVLGAAWLWRRRHAAVSRLPRRPTPNGAAPRTDSPN